jgi:hypothetical protein
MYCGATCKIRNNVEKLSFAAHNRTVHLSDISQSLVESGPMYRMIKRNIVLIDTAVVYYYKML